MKKYISNLAGKNIYLDMYGDNVYYNFVDKKGYLISKEIEPKFRIFYNRYAMLLILLVLLGDYFKTLTNTLLIGIGAAILLELYFRFVYLKKLKVVRNFKREKKLSKVEALVRSKETQKMMMRAGAYTALSILVVLNAIEQNFNMVFIALSLVIAGYSLYFSIINIIACKRVKTKKVTV